MTPGGQQEEDQLRQRKQCADGPMLRWLVPGDKKIVPLIERFSDLSCE